MAIEIVDFPIENGGSFHSFLYVYQRVCKVILLLGGLEFGFLRCRVVEFFASEVGGSNHAGSMTAWRAR